MSDINPETSFNSYARRCWVVLAAVVAVTLVMVGASYLPMPSRSMSIAVILTAAVVNASLVAGYLMHVISEKRMIWAVLAFTVVFFIGLMGLTAWSYNDVIVSGPR